jgi:hypothetical protein
MTRPESQGEGRDGRRLDRVERFGKRQRRIPRVGDTGARNASLTSKFESLLLPQEGRIRPLEREAFACLDG